MYELLESYPTAKGRPNGSEVFLNSLELTPAPPPGPLKVAGPVFETFAPPGGGCSLSMPAKAKPFTTPAADGSEAGFTQYIAEYGDRVYMLGFVTLPKELNSESITPTIFEQLLIAFDGKRQAPPTPSTTNRMQMQTLFFTRPDGDVGRADVTTSGHRAFAVIMLYPPGHAGSPDIDTFFNSFKLLPPEPKTK